MEAEVSVVVDRPVAIVWDFFAVRHVENHPRWDPDIRLEPTSGAIGVGTVIKRWNTRSGTPIEGTMEVVEFVPESLMAMKTQDGPVEIDGQAIFARLDEQRTRLTLRAEFPQMDDSMAEKIVPLMQRSADRIKRLVESEG